MDPIAFQFGNFAIHWYGVFVALGFLAGIWTASRRGLRDNLDPEKITDAVPWLLLGTLVGARLFHVVTYWEQDFAQEPITKIFAIRGGGLVFYGGFVGASLATIFYARWKKIPLWKFADALAPSVALGHAFGRIGCLMTGCCHGKPCSLPWAIRFPEGHETHPVGFDAVPVHPTQIYEAVLNFGLYLGLAWFYRRKKFPGQVFAMYLIGYALLRAIVEQFRGDYSAREYLFQGWVSPGQAMGILAILAGIILLWKLPRPAQEK